MAEQILPTRKVINKESGQPQIINVDDFDPKYHEVPEDEVDTSAPPAPTAEDAQGEGGAKVITDLTVAEARKVIENAGTETLNEIEKVEKEGKARVGVLDAVAARRQVLAART